MSNRVCARKTFAKKHLDCRRKLLLKYCFCYCFQLSELERRVLEAETRAVEAEGKVSFAKLINPIITNSKCYQTLG